MTHRKWEEKDKRCHGKGSLSQATSVVGLENFSRGIRARSNSLGNLVRPAGGRRDGHAIGIGTLINLQLLCFLDGTLESSRSLRSTRACCVGIVSVVYDGRSNPILFLGKNEHSSCDLVLILRLRWAKIPEVYAGRRAACAAKWPVYYGFFHGPWTACIRPRGLPAMRGYPDVHGLGCSYYRSLSAMQRTPIAKGKTTWAGPI
jgi:hypothetical protein